MWQANKYAMQDPERVTASRMPDLQTLQGLAMTNEDKCSVLLETFFPPPPNTDLHDIDKFDYPPALDNSVITEAEVGKAIDDLDLYKASRPNTISNIAIQSVQDIIRSPLTLLFNACIRYEHQPTLWKTFTMITLRKPQKPDYSVLKAYRPIALEDTVGKVLKLVVAQHLSLLTKQHGLLPPNHFSGRPGRTTTNAILYLVQRIKDTWRGKEVVSVLFLDISQAFPFVSHTKLLHNLKKRSIPQNLVS